MDTDAQGSLPSSRRTRERAGSNETMEPMLTVDLGNSRLKACLWRAAPDDLPECLARLELPGESLTEFGRWLEPLRPRAAALSSVGSHELTARVCALLA